MPSFYETVFVKENIIHLGALLYLSGFLFRDQLLLRSLIVAGDLIYVLYFYFAPDTPLWGGIFWSTLFVLVNTYMVVTILADRMHFRLKPQEQALFKQLGALSPGQFRELLRLSHFTVADGRTELTREGEPVDTLFFVIDGEIEVRKGASEVARGSQRFVGEIAFLLGQPASATVYIEKDASYFGWRGDALRQFLQKRPELETALERAMSRDMAAKVAMSGRSASPA